MYDDALKDAREIEFLIDYKMIHCHIQYFKQLETKYFNKLIQRGECQVIQLKNRGSWIECNKNISLFDIDGESVLVFYFDKGFELSISFNELLLPSKTDVTKVIFGIENMSNWYIPWIIGEVMLRKHKYIFDVDKEQIAFYISEKGYYSNNSIRQGLKIIIMVLSFVLIIHSCFIVILMLSNKEFFSYKLFRLNTAYLNR